MSSSRRIGYAKTEDTVQRPTEGFMGSARPVSERELWEFVDGGLVPERRRQIEQLLEADATLAADVAAMRRQNDLQKAVGGAAMEAPIPDRLRDVLREKEPRHKGVKGRRRKH